MLPSAESSNSDTIELNPPVTHSNTNSLSVAPPLTSEPTFLREFTHIVIAGGMMTISDWFAWLYLCFPFLSSAIDSSPLNIAAIGPTIGLNNAVCISALSPFFAIDLEGSPVVGQLNKLNEQSQTLPAYFLSWVEEIPNKENLRVLSQSQICIKDHVLYFYNNDNLFQVELSSESLSELNVSFSAHEHIERLSDAQTRQIILIAIKDGQRKINSLFRNGILMMSILAPLVITTFLLSKPILQHGFRQHETVAQISQDFLAPHSLAVPGTFFSILASQFLQIFNCNKPMIAAPISTVLSLGLAASLGLGIGFPKMGLTGVLIAYNLNSYIIAIFYGASLVFLSRFRDFSFFKHLFSSLKGNLKPMKNLLKTGSIMTINVMIETMTSFGIAILAGLLSISAQEALAITMPLTLISNVIAVFFSLASSILLGTRIGEGRSASVPKVALAGLCASALIGCIIPIIFAIFPGILKTIFNSHDEDTNKTLDLLIPITSLNSFLDIIRFVFVTQLRRFGDMKSSTAISIITLVFGLLCSAILGLFTDLGILGVALGSTSGMLSANLILGVKWKKAITSYINASRVHEDTPMEAETTNMLESATSATSPQRTASCLSRFTQWSGSFFQPRPAAERPSQPDLPHGILTI